MSRIYGTRDSVLATMTGSGSLKLHMGFFSGPAWPNARLRLTQGSSSGKADAKPFSDCWGYNIELSRLVKWLNIAIEGYGQNC